MLARKSLSIIFFLITGLCAYSQGTGKFYNKPPQEGEQAAKTEFKFGEPIYARLTLNATLLEELVSANPDTDPDEIKKWTYAPLRLDYDNSNLAFMRVTINPELLNKKILDVDIWPDTNKVFTSFPQGGSHYSSIYSGYLPKAKNNMRLSLESNEKVIASGNFSWDATDAKKWQFEKATQAIYRAYDRAKAKKITALPKEFSQAGKFQEAAITADVLKKAFMKACADCQIVKFAIAPQSTDDITIWKNDLGIITTKYYNHPFYIAYKTKTSVTGCEYGKFYIIREYIQGGKYADPQIYHPETSEIPCDLIK